MTKNDRFTLGFAFVKVFCDIITVYLTFILTYFIRFHSGLFPVELGIPSLVKYQTVFVFGTALIIILFRHFGLYKGFRKGGHAEESIRIMKGVIIGIFIMMAFSFLYREFQYSRGVALIAMPLVVIGMVIQRILIEQVEFHIRTKKGLFTRVLILGCGDDAVKVAKGMERNKALGCEVIGFMTDKGTEGKAGQLPYKIIGNIDSLQEIIKKEAVDEIIMAEKEFPHEKIVSIIVTCEKNLVSFKLVPGILEMMTSSVDVSSVDGVTLLNIHHFPLQSLWSRCLKRGFDFTGSLIGLILFSPLLLITAVLVKLDSKGPIFYLQERCGEDGKLFNIIKFRTMIVGAEKETGPVWTKKDDSRRTKVGEFLRKTNIDEFPQLINVLKGDMSLVGPRPERPHFVKQFKEDVPRYMSRHFIKSGITGWAQVNGLRGETPIEERIKYDLYYIENWSLLFDIRILFLTLFARKNAY